MTTHIYLVMLPDRAGLYGATLDERAAHSQARLIKGVVAAVPVSGDYREQEGKQNEGH